jgi:hypothetical protein
MMGVRVSFARGIIPHKFFVIIDLSVSHAWTHPQPLP